MPRPLDLVEYMERTKRLCRGWWQLGDQSNGAKEIRKVHLYHEVHDMEGPDSDDEDDMESPIT